MYYDKQSGEIKITESKNEKESATKKLIKNIDDLEQEKMKLLKEVGLDEHGRSKNPKEDVDKYAEKIKTV